MRLIVAMLPFLCANPVLAQPAKVWTDAPVPGTGAPGVAPADRAGSIVGPDTSAPFSGLPSGNRTGGQASQTARDTAPNADTVTPNVSR